MMEGSSTFSGGLLVSSTVLFVAATDLSDSAPSDAATNFASVDIVRVDQSLAKKTLPPDPFQICRKDRGKGRSSMLFQLD
jgi:hypothetical protein